MNRVRIALAVCALIAAGCSGGVREKTSAADAPDPRNDGVFKVALITPGSVSDSGWNALAYRGLEAMRDELGAEIAQTEATDTQIRDALRSYAQSGYDLVIGHGYEFNEPSLEIAKDFPWTAFVSSSGQGTSDNVGAFRFVLEEGFYLAGYVAGSQTKTGVVAMIGFNMIPSIKSTFRAFAAGARAANSAVVVIEPDMDGKEDIAAMKQATLAAIDFGADFVIHQANDKAQGVFDACRDKGVLAFGANSDQNDNPSGVVVASAVIDFSAPYIALARSVRDGEYVGSSQMKFMKDGAIDFIWNPAFLDRFPEELVAKIAEMQQQIIDGDLQVPFDEF